MKTLKTSKKDKEGFTQPRGETLRKVFPSNISIFLNEVFINQLGTERTILEKKGEEFSIIRNSQTNQLSCGLRRDTKGFRRSGNFFSLSKRL